MRRRLIVMLAVLATATAMAVPAVGAAPPSEGDAPVVDDNLSSPLADAQAAAKKAAQEAVLTGKSTPNAKGVVQVAHGQFVELERQGEDLIWTTLGEFADLSHNSIPEPDRNVDNTTYWVDDFSADHFEELLFSEEPDAISMRNFYIEMSSNRYTVDGEVEDWVAVSGNQADYAYPDFSLTWNFIEESVDNWWAEKLSTMSADDVNDYLSQFDVWDRYDYDGDGNFNEPDGYIDHYQAVHAGGGAEAGVPNAIWSHRWYVQLTPIGSGGPTVDGNVVPFGGTQIGDSDYWIGDYTAEPENGGLGVFAHEFAHDLGLPDLYDTVGAGGTENSTGWWTLMSQGSWGSAGTIDIGTKPTHMGAWEKFQLGWLNYDVAVAGQKSSHKLGPASTNTKQAQGLFVLLPDKEVTLDLGDPYAGENFYYSGSGNDLDVVMYREVDLPANAELTAQVNYDIEADWDYAYVVVSTDGGASWDSVPTSESDEAGNPNGQDFGHGISGDSGGWVGLTADLSGYTGPTLVGFRYWTDVAVVEPGFSADEIVIASDGPFGAEVEDEFTLDGFRITTGEETSFAFNAYVAEFRNYRGYDDSLRTGPYNFGFLDNPNLGNWVEHFSLQDGLLISYWDGSQTDNDTSLHPGEGLILPIDAHPEALVHPDFGIWRNRVQSYDSTFTLEPTEGYTLHLMSQPGELPSLPGESVFDDNNTYWDSANPTGSVNHPHTDTQIAIRSISARGNFMQVQVR